MMTDCVGRYKWPEASFTPSSSTDAGTCSVSLERPNAPRSIVAERAPRSARPSEGGGERRGQTTETFGRGLGTESGD